MHTTTPSIDQKTRLNTQLLQNPLKLITFAVCHKKAFQFKQKYKIGKKTPNRQQNQKKSSIAKLVSKKGIGHYINSCVGRKCFLPAEGRGLIVKAVKKGGVKNEEVRKRLWLLLTETYANIKLHENYYSNLNENEFIKGNDLKTEKNCL